MKLLLLLLLLAAPLRAEEIRIEVARGLREAVLDGRRVTVRGDALLAGGARVEPPLAGARLDGRKLPGRVELYPQDGALLVVNVVDLEDYVAAVVSSEVPASWPREALRAQAVAARTFAVAQKVAQGPGARAHLGSSVLDQVYKAAAHPQPGALEAARSTAGEVLTFGAAPIAAYFSASCGGIGESAEAAFHAGAPYLPGGAPDDDERPWTVRVPYAEMTRALRARKRMTAEVRGLSVAVRTKTGRADTLRVETSAGAHNLAAVELRQLLGWSRLPSLLFTVRADRDAAVFTGRGSGHGVGLCQYGARARAEKGADYRAILARYYPGTEIRRMY